MQTQPLRQAGVSQQVAHLVTCAENDLMRDVFPRRDAIAEVCQYRIIRAFQQLGIAPRHFSPTTGYGYSDEGREALDRVFAGALGCDAALVRPQFLSGTHTLAVCLFAALRPGDLLVCATGTPYDTLLPVLGLAGDREDSLRAWGVECRVLPLREGCIPVEALQELLAAQPEGRRILVSFQRSRGYSLRPSLTVRQLNEAIDAVYAVRPDAKTLVDNCYGEFVEPTEPSGADMLAGSLIKNPGGGLAPTGGYVAGRADMIEKVSHRLSAPGLGGEVGSYAAGYLPFFQGLFLAPAVVASACKGAALCAKVFDAMGYAALPAFDAPRADIIQSITLRTPRAVQAFCKGVQQAAAVDSMATPLPWDMPGYDDPVIMAAGTFIQGGSVELSADAPMREPYAVFFQGGLTYAHAKLGVAKAAQEVLALAP